MKNLNKNDKWINNANQENLKNNAVFLLDEAFEKNLNTSLYHDKFLAQVLAIIYIYSCEAIVFNGIIQNIIPIAMKRFNILGGLEPNRRCRLVKAAIKSLEKRGVNDPLWKPIIERLGMKTKYFKGF